jgi:hypothetical protein
MKKFNLVAVAALFFGAMFVQSCEKEPTTTTPTETTGVVTMSVNSKSWTSNKNGEMLITGEDTLYGCEAVVEDGMLTLSATNFKDSSVVGFNFVLTAAVTGTYSGKADFTADDYAIYAPKADVMTLLTLLMNYDITYSVTLTKVDKTTGLCSGYFSITQTDNASTGMGNFNITNGKFTDVKMTVL